jgi:hypothetical protein
MAMRKTLIAIGVLAAFACANVNAGAKANTKDKDSLILSSKTNQQASVAAKKRAERLDTARANAALAGSSNVDADARRSLRGG